MPGHPVKPVQKVKDSVYCPHCRLILRDAVQTDEGERVCESCCTEIKKMPGFSCSECGIAIHSTTQIYPDRAARKEISLILVHCRHEATGCPWTGSLKEEEGHGGLCDYRQVQCSHPGCTAWSTPLLLPTHTQECVHREVSCKYCYSTLRYSQLPTHYAEECDDYPQPCRQCGQAVSRRRLKQHLLAECKIEECLICKTMVKRSTAEEVGSETAHLSTPVVVFRHTQTLADKYQQVSEGLLALKAAVDQFQEGKSISDSLVPRLEGLERAMKDWGESMELQQTVRLQHKALESQSQQIAELTGQLQTLKVTCEQSNQAIKSLQQQGSPRSQSQYEDGRHRPWDSVADSRWSRMERRLEDLEGTTASLRLHIAELQLQLQASLACTHDGCFLWRIPEVARRKRDAFEGRITSIYSPPFYSGRNGYKMCIRAYLNGDGIGFKTHLSVFFVLMKGEYDPLLKWPFENKVSLILVDQNLRKHVVQTFKPTAESNSFQRPRQDMNVASGCPQFAKLSILENNDYIKDDVMFLKCIVDASKIFHP